MFKALDHFVWNSLGAVGGMMSRWGWFLALVGAFLGVLALLVALLFYVSVAFVPPDL